MKMDVSRMIADGPTLPVDIEPDAAWTIGKRPTGYITVGNEVMPYWMPDEKPIGRDDEDIPF